MEDRSKGRSAGAVPEPPANAFFGVNPGSVAAHAGGDELAARARLRAAALEQRRAAAERLAALSRPGQVAARPTLCLTAAEPEPAPHAPPEPGPPADAPREQATDLGLLLIDFAEANIRRNLDMARALLCARSFDEARERHALYLASTTRMYADQAAELAMLAAKSGVSPRP